MNKGTCPLLKENMVKGPEKKKKDMAELQHQEHLN